MVRGQKASELLGGVPVPEKQSGVAEETVSDPNCPRQPVANGESFPQVSNGRWPCRVWACRPQSFSLIDGLQIIPIFHARQELVVGFII